MTLCRSSLIGIVTEMIIFAWLGHHAAAAPQRGVRGERHQVNLRRFTERSLKVLGT